MLHKFQKFRYCGTGVQNSQKFRAGTKGAVPVPRVLWHGVYRTHRSFGYGYESVTQLPEVPGIVARAYRTHRSSGRVQNALYPYPGYCGTGCTKLTEVPGTGMNVLQNLQNFGCGYESLTELPEVPGIVTWSYRTYRSSGYGYECPT